MIYSYSVVIIKYNIIGSVPTFLLIYVAKIQHQNIEISHNRKNYDYINGDPTITESENFRPINTNNNYTNKINKTNKNSIRYSGRDYSPEFLNSLYANV